MQFIKGLRTIILIFLISHVFGEIGLRLYNYLNPQYIFYDRSYNRWRGKPNSCDYNFRLNSKGFKDLEYGDKKDNVFRIIGIGDSFVYGVVPYEFNFLTILENRLNTKDKSVEVINMGIPATGPADYLSLFIDEGLSLDPDLLLVSVFIGNDFTDGRRRRKLYEYSYVASLYRYLAMILFKQTQVANIPILMHEGLIYDDNALTMSSKFFLTVEKERSFVCNKSWELFPELLNDVICSLEKIKKICKKNNIEMIVIIIPDEYQVNPELRSFIAHWARKGMMDFAYPNTSLSNKLKAIGIDCIDLYEPFVKASEKKCLYKPCDTHWNIAGNRLASKLIGDHIYENYLKRNILPAKKIAAQSIIF